MTARIRPATTDDLPQLYAISLATGLRGGDAAGLYADPLLMGQIYAAPYLRFPPAICLVAADDHGVAGFALGVVDTGLYEDWLEADWWPALRRHYPAPPADRQEDWTADQRRCAMIHHPARVPGVIAGDFPAHLHLNLLPRLQGRGLGRQMLTHWLALASAQGARAVHVAVNHENTGALAFWPRCGFAPVPAAGSLPQRRTVWLGRVIA